MRLQCHYRLARDDRLARLRDKSRNSAMILYLIWPPERHALCSGGSLPYLGVSDRQLFPDRSQMWGLKSRFRIRKFGARIGYIGGRLVQSV